VDEGNVWIAQVFASNMDAVIIVLKGNIFPQVLAHSPVDEGTEEMGCSEKELCLSKIGGGGQRERR
jgi:hypothetical protein